jgi:hypothetical protein
MATSPLVSTSVRLDATALKALLSELRFYDKELYKEITKALVGSAQPIATAVGTAFPGKAPLKNWHQTNRRKGEARLPGYNAANVRRGVKAVVPRPKSYSGGFGVRPILRLEQKNAAGAIFDTAGSAMANAKGERFIKNLDKHARVRSKGDGFRSRIMYPFTKRNMPLVEKSVALTIKAQNGRIRARLKKPKAA